MERWTLITGATGGFGQEFAQLAADEGRNLILTDLSEEALEELAARLRSNRVTVVTIPADLTEPEQVAALWEKASQDRQIDMLVNNAGLGLHGNFNDEEGWDRERTSIDVNVTALTDLMKRAIPHMQAAGEGRILNLASLAAFMPGPQMAVYHATKAYVLSLSRAAAVELRGTGVTVTALCPGLTDTGFFDGADMHKIRILQLSNAMASEPVAKAGWEAAKAGRGVIVTGGMNKLLAFLPRLIPSRIVTAVVNWCSTNRP